MNGSSSLVPPGRLGALLTEQRTRRGLTVEELCVATHLPFDPDELRRIEQGRLSLTDDQVTRLMVAYEAFTGPVVPERSELVVDLEHGALFAGPRTRVLPEGAGFDDILSRYLSLLYLMRGLEPGHELVLRGDDLDVLSAALERTVAEVEGRLFELMAPDQVGPWIQRLRNRLAVPAAGILVGLTTVGSLVFVQLPEGDRPTVASAPSGTAAAADGTEPADVVMAATVVAPADAEIAAPVVVERGSVDAAALRWTAGDPASVGAAAEQLVNFDYATHLDGWIIVYDGPRDGYRGNANTVTRIITVHVDVDDTPGTVADVLAHEIGHALDVMYLDDETRTEWMSMRGIDGPWWPDSGAADFHVGAGDFAEAVARVIADSPSDSAHGEFSAAELELVRSLLPA